MMLDHYTKPADFTKNDPWVKELKKAYEPKEIATLIQKRLERPYVIGPWLNKDEEASDIIDKIIAKKEGNRKKIAPAVGLLLYNLLNEQVPESHELLRGIFNIIGNSKLQECGSLVRKWLIAKKDAMNIDDVKWRTTYRVGMNAYAFVQDLKDEPLRRWWYNVWKDSSSFYWSVAFIGLRMQDPKAAAKELPTLIDRRYDKTSQILVAMWCDDQSRIAFENVISIALNDGETWAGIALNCMLEKLDDEKRKELLLGLKKVIYLV
jgi:hypothetical protein